MMAHTIDLFRCHEQTTAITVPRLTPLRTTLTTPPSKGRDSKTTSARIGTVEDFFWGGEAEYQRGGYGVARRTP